MIDFKDISVAIQRLICYEGNKNKNLETYMRSQIYVRSWEVFVLNQIIQEGGYVNRFALDYKFVG